MEELTEKEQIEKFRDWWKENGNFVIGGIVLGIAIMYGNSKWKSINIEKQVTASIQFEALMGEVEDGNLEAAEAVVAELYDQHAASVYTAQARLAMARLYMDKGQDEDAADTLRGMLSGDRDNEMRRIGRLRLARVLLYQNKPQEVVDLLEGQADSEFRARFSELLGDAYAVLGRNDDAAEAYELALSDGQRLPTIDNSLLQWKIVDLPDASESQDSDGAAATDVENAEAAADPAAEESGE